MNNKKQRSAVWSMINWAKIHQKVVRHTAVTPDQASIEEAIKSVESDHPEDELFLMEADALERLLVKKLTQILQKNRGKEIKKNQSQRERIRRSRKERMQNMDVKILPMGSSMKDLKDMGLDPAAVEQISRKMMEQLFGKRKKKKGDDDDEEEDRGSSFYM